MRFPDDFLLINDKNLLWDELNVRKDGVICQAQGAPMTSKNTGCGFQEVTHAIGLRSSPPPMARYLATIRPILQVSIWMTYRNPKVDSRRTNHISKQNFKPQTTDLRDCLNPNLISPPLLIIIEKVNISRSSLHFVRASLSWGRFLYSD